MFCLIISLSSFFLFPFQLHSFFFSQNLFSPSPSHLFFPLYLLPSLNLPLFPSLLTSRNPLNFSKQPFITRTPSLSFYSFPPSSLLRSFLCNRLSCPPISVFLFLSFPSCLPHRFKAFCSSTSHNQADATKPRATGLRPNKDRQASHQLVNPGVIIDKARNLVS
jgi:hypothetical protein